MSKGKLLSSLNAETFSCCSDPADKLHVLGSALGEFVVLDTEDASVFLGRAQWEQLKAVVDAHLAPVSLAVHDEYGWRGSVGWLAFCWHVGTMI
jgi:hypothetical protein